MAAMKRFDESILHIRKAQEIEGPLAFGINTDIGEIYCWAGQYDRAAEHLQTVIGIEPTFAMARNTLGITYIKSGRQAEALTELEAARLLDNGPRMISSLGYAYGASGQPEKARQIIAELRKLSEKRYVSSFAVAIVHLGLGEHDAALSLLEKAYDERSDTMAIMTVYPLLDDLRGDPRFVALSKRVGLVP